jgi:hypothetical protein
MLSIRERGALAGEGMRIEREKKKRHRTRQL